MTLNPQIISYAQEIIRSKGMRELNLIRGEADQLNSTEREKLTNLIQQSWTKITPTEYVLATKLTELLQNSALNQENPEKSQQTLLTQLALSEPREACKQKAPFINALYQQKGTNDFWQNAEENQQKQAIEQIIATAHLIKKDADFRSFEHVLALNKIETLDDFKNLQNTLNLAGLLNLPKKSVPQSVRPQSTPEPLQNPAPVDHDKIRIEQTMQTTAKHKIDFGARKQLTGEIKIPQPKKETKNEKIRHAYAKLEEEAQKHLEETLKQENRNLKNLHWDQKRFQTTTVAKSKAKKWYRTWKLAAVTTGGTIAWGSGLLFLWS